MEEKLANENLGRCWNWNCPSSYHLAFLAYLESFHGCPLDKVRTPTGHDIQCSFDHDSWPPFYPHCRYDLPSTPDTTWVPCPLTKWNNRTFPTQARPSLPPCLCTCSSPPGRVSFLSFPDSVLSPFKTQVKKLLCQKGFLSSQFPHSLSHTFIRYFLFYSQLEGVHTILWYL